ncbi:MAG: ABC transporter ATP-binding protein [Acidobacteria bacterium]|nr:ABC transporter ATP-binding protein [Acidobacteriota bacterium]
MTPAIRLEHLTKAFDGRRVLDDVTLDVSPGSAFCLLGRSGTGKSVTLRHIVGLVMPDEGRVLVDGEDIGALRPWQLARVRKRMGFLFQNAALFDSMTVGENVAFPLRRHTTLSETDIQARVMAKLDAVGLARDAHKMPSELSGGMRKRVGLARAMALDPAILLVDEPGAGLDPITTREIDDLLVAQKAAGVTLVVVTHNIPSARVIADDMALLHEGRVVARGSVAEMDASADPLVQAFMRSEAGG